MYLFVKVGTPGDHPPAFPCEYMVVNNCLTLELHVFDFLQANIAKLNHSQYFLGYSIFFVFTRDLNISFCRYSLILYIEFNSSYPISNVMCLIAIEANYCFEKCTLVQSEQPQVCHQGEL